MVIPAPGDQLGRFTDWRLAYTLQRVREQSRGFTGTTSGDPALVAWSRASLDARHQFTASLSTRASARPSRSRRARTLRLASRILPSSPVM
jgi:hypothetical protein